MSQFIETYQVWIVLIVLLFIVLSLFRNWLKPATTFFVAVLFFGLTGILSSEDVLHGFSNVQIANLMMLLVIGGVVSRTVTLDRLFKRIFWTSKTYKGFLFKMMALVSTMSAFINNTPIVAILIPHVYRWAKRHNVSISRLLIPLSFAAILGGTATLIGTSTNLLINALTIDSGLEAFKFFDFTIIGLPLLIIGIIYMLLFGHKLLPTNEDLISVFEENEREFIVQTKVRPDSELVNKTIQEAELRELQSAYLVEIIRGEETITHVTPDSKIYAGDSLIFAGNVEAITEMVNNTSGLQIPKMDWDFTANPNHEILEVVIAPNSLLNKKRLRDSNFRANFDASVVAIHRNGEHIPGKLGNVLLRPGDVLLLVTGDDFYKRVTGTNNFYIINKIKQPQTISKRRSLVLIGSLAAAIVASIFNILPLFQGLLITLLVIFGLKVITFQELKRLIDGNLLILACLALAIGRAVLNTGTADVIAENLFWICEPLGVIGVMIAIYLITVILTELMTNVAAATLAFPLALSFAASMGIEAKPLILLIAIGASASFLTPLGYQTNLMVYGPGKYSFKDFFKVGLPLSIMYGVASIWIIKVFYHL